MSVTVMRAVEPSLRATVARALRLSLGVVLQIIAFLGGVVPLAVVVSAIAENIGEGEGVPALSQWPAAIQDVARSFRANSAEVSWWPWHEIRGNVMFFGIAILTVFYFAGRWTIRGRRPLVLFLRRFGHRESTNAMTIAAHRVGASWRLVTLDDAQIAPVGAGSGAQAVAAVERGMSWLTRLVPRLPRAGTKAARAGWSFVAERPWVIGVPSVLLFQGFADVHHPAIEIARALLLLLIVPSVAYLLVVIPLLGLFRTLFTSVREAEAARTVEVSDADGVQRARLAILERGVRVFSPRLTVLRVNGAVWQRTVTELVAVCDLVLIDVSEPTDHLLWEIESTGGAQCLFVGHDVEVENILRGDTVNPLRQRLCTLLDGHEVLLYSDGRPGARRFVRSLRSTFTQRIRDIDEALPPRRVLVREDDSTFRIDARSYASLAARRMFAWATAIAVIAAFAGSQRDGYLTIRGGVAAGFVVAALALWGATRAAQRRQTRLGMDQQGIVVARNGSTRSVAWSDVAFVNRLEARGQSRSKPPLPVLDILGPDGELLGTATDPTAVAGMRDSVAGVGVA